MATSGAMSTDNKYIKYTITVTQNSQSIANNTSNVTVSVRFYRTNTGYTSYGTGTVYCTIDGTEYSASVTPSQKITSSGIVLFTKTLTIKHNDEGKKTLTCKAKISHNVVTSSYQSYSQDLTQIKRASTFTRSGPAIMTHEETITITRQSSSFTHTLKYTFGGSTVTIATGIGTSYKWTPLVSMATKIPKATSGTCVLTLETYYGTSLIGSKTLSFTLSVPSSVVPTVSKFTLSEAISGLANQFMTYVKGKSKISYKVTAAGVQGSTISSYSVSIAGQSLTGATGTTGFISVTGTQTATVTVTDSRGRKATKTTTFTVADYYAPSFTAIAVNRCLADGTLDDEGECLSFTVGLKIAPVNNMNIYSTQLLYKKTTESEYKSLTLKATGYTYSGTTVFTSPVFSVDNSYNIRFIVEDYFAPVTRNLTLSSAAFILDILPDGSGIGLGKAAELPNVCDIGYQTKFTGGKRYEVAEKVADLNELILPNTYVSVNNGAASYSNVPEGLIGTFTIEVLNGGAEGQLIQRLTTCSKTHPTVYIRHYYQGSWGSWLIDYEYILYDNAQGSSGTITLSQSVSVFKYIEIFYSDNNNKLCGSVKLYSPNGKSVTLSSVEAGSATTTFFRRTTYAISGTTITPSVETSGYARITSATPAHVTGENYLKITRVVGRG